MTDPNLVQTAIKGANRIRRLVAATAKLKAKKKPTAGHKARLTEYAPAIIENEAKLKMAIAAGVKAADLGMTDDDGDLLFPDAFGNQYPKDHITGALKLLEGAK